MVIIRGEKQLSMCSWDEVLKMGDEVSDEILEERRESLDFDDLINIQYTSGTTGLPKGVVLTHHNILNNGYFIVKCMKFAERIGSSAWCFPIWPL